MQARPQSAGAAPGPVCYDTGGEIPTITDANVLLGYLNPGHLIGGALKLNAAKARAAFTEKVARPLGMPLERAAYGAYLIAASNMIRAIKASPSLKIAFSVPVRRSVASMHGPRATPLCKPCRNASGQIASRTCRKIVDTRVGA